MIDAILQGLTSLLSWPTFGWMIFGVLIGLVIAIIPGIGSVSMLGVLVPFTFVMEPQTAFAMLVGFLAVGCTADSIPAILLGIPGSASSQATILDGYAMTKRGQASRALGASFTASMIGGLFGALILSLTIPVMRPFVLMFGAPEFLVLALWGISMVAVLAGSSPLKGLAVGGFGLLLGSVGTDPNLGFARWTFQQAYFLEGISLTIVGLGIFAVPELISLAVNRGKISQSTEKPHLLRGQLEGVKDVFRHWGVVIRSSSLGTLVGAIPGIGSAVVDWLAYGMTVQTSRNKENFGKGDVRGVIGVDGANNAIYGGSMIPTLGFGIPGSTSMAFLLIVMFAHGVQAGSGMLTNTSNLSLVYFFVWGLAIANIIGALICFAGSGFLVRITLIPYFYLFALLIPIMFLAAYYSKNSIWDLYVLLILSVVGYLFKQLGWPRAPLLIGIVLSKMVEANLNVSMSIFGYSWMHRPIVLVLWVIIIIMLIVSIRSMRSYKFNPPKEKNGEDHETAEQPETPVQAKSSLLQRFGSSGAWFTMLLLIVTASAMIPALEWPKQAARFPLLICSFILVILILQLINDFRAKPGMGGIHFDLPPDLQGSPMLLIRRSIAMFAWVIGLMLAVITLGLAVALPLFALVYMIFAGKVRIIPAIVWTAILAIVIISFGNFAGVYWNKGIWLSLFLG